MNSFQIKLSRFVKLVALTNLLILVSCGSDDGGNQVTGPNPNDNGGSGGTGGVGIDCGDYPLPAQCEGGGGPVTVTAELAGEWQTTFAIDACDEESQGGGFPSTLTLELGDSLKPILGAGEFVDMMEDLEAEGLVCEMIESSNGVEKFRCTGDAGLGCEVTWEVESRYKIDSLEFCSTTRISLLAGCEGMAEATLQFSYSGTKIAGGAPNRR